MSALDIIIQKIDASTDKGTLFEKLCLYFLKHDPTQQSIFSHVWHWDEWPGNNGEPDTGIDIVAQFRDSESFCAVQCKFREDDSSIKKSEIDSFLALSSKEIFSERIIFALTDNFNDKAKNAIKGQSPEVRIFTRKNFEDSNIDWDSFDFSKPEKISYKRNKFRQYQEDAINAVLNGLVNHDKGKLIMACGTGKTFVSLIIAEEYSGRGGLVLVLVPSISLLSQSVSAWNCYHHENIPLISFPVCSDSSAGYDEEDMRPEDLSFRPDTNAGELVQRWQNAGWKPSSLSVVFSTYQSLKVIHDAQEKGLPRFDLVICDEAHRTAGVSPNSEEALFQLIHKEEYISARKRLYMTATPKIFGDTPAHKAAIKKKAEENNAVLYSMDDEDTYGPEFFRFSFSDAIEAGQLSDYKVIVFTYNIDPDSKTARKIDDKHYYTPSDKAKIIGIRRALAKELFPADFASMKDDLQPMRSAVVFTNTINASETFRDAFRIVTHEADSLFTVKIDCKTEHVDGKTPASERSKKISALQNVPEGSCRILSNARCLSEGIDVPALDAIVFLNPKRSEVDIVQSAGRVMRKAEGKKFGYVILLVAVRPGSKPHEELDKNEEWSTVWKLLKAMRSHDDTFQSAVINALSLNGKSEKIIIVPPIGNDTEEFSQQMMIDFTEWEKAITAKIVEKCGDREYWDKWVSDLASVAESHTQNLRSALKIPGAKIAFDKFADDLRHTINPSISDDDALSMLAQHIVSKRVFDELFTEFSHLNPVSRALQSVISSLSRYGFSPDDSRLNNFYGHVHEAVKEAKTDAAKQNLIRRIYENFFKLAFKKVQEKLGIVYTPIQIVDFILKSSDWAVRKLLGIDGFDGGLASPNVQILDPFSGTGTFTARLIQSGIIPHGWIGRKYRGGQIFANEILLLPYYISAVNIEAAFTQINDGEYSEFPGMILTDTFMLDPYATPPLHPVFYENGERAHKETQSAVNVIIGNPPYSVGQKNANDNNQNTIYPALRGLVKSSYAKESTATNKNSLYDSYILAFKWASERLKGSRGVICFVTNGSFIDSNSADGMRKCLANDFAYIYIFNLRGNQRAADWRKEGEKVFGEGSQCPVAVTMLVKDESRKGNPCEIYYYEVGDEMKRDAKLAELAGLGDFGKMISAGLMRRIEPNDAGDWVTQRAEIYSEFVNLGNKKEDRPAIFGERYSRGVITCRDAWCYNFSRESLSANMAGMIEVYNSERERWHKNGAGKIEGFVTNDKHKISWSITLYGHAKRNRPSHFDKDKVRVSLYRPYVKEYLYFDRIMNEATYQMPHIFPEHDTKNLVISIPGIGSKKDFSVLMTDCIPEVQMMMNGQCLPLYWYTRGEQMTLFESGLVRHDGISDSALREFRTRYADGAITKRDIFSYIYGVLSSREYALRFGNEAKKVLARVPYVKDAETFRAFSEAGRKLGELHVNYESADEWPLEVSHEGGRITKLTVNKKDKNDKSTWEITGPGVSVTGIPESAWEYKVNGRSALEWIVERYRDDTDKDSGIRNDCNEWGGAAYVMRLIRRVVTVSVETVRILEGLPELGV